MQPPLGELLQKNGKPSKWETCPWAVCLMYDCEAQVRIWAQALKQAAGPEAELQDVQEIWDHLIHLLGIRFFYFKTQVK